MAGFEIVDTYKAYKVREKKVTAWLKETAAKFGFRSRGDAPSPSNGASDAKTERLIRISEVPVAVRVIVNNGEYVFRSHIAIHGPDVLSWNGFAQC